MEAKIQRENCLNCYAKLWIYNFTNMKQSGNLINLSSMNGNKGWGRWGCTPHSLSCLRPSIRSLWAKRTESMLFKCDEKHIWSEYIVAQRVAAVVSLLLRISGIYVIFEIQKKGKKAADKWHEREGLRVNGNHSGFAAKRIRLKNVADEHEHALPQAFEQNADEDDDKATLFLLNTIQSI